MDPSERPSATTLLYQLDASSIQVDARPLVTITIAKRVENKNKGGDKGNRGKGGGLMGRLRRGIDHAMRKGADLVRESIMTR